MPTEFAGLVLLRGWLTKTLGSLLCVGAMGTAALAAPKKAVMSAEVPAERRYDFEADVPGQPPVGFAFEHGIAGKPGRWVVAKDSKGKGLVLAQTELEPNKNRFLFAVADAPARADGNLRVRCRMIAGTKDQACGLLFRYRDPNNHYLVRADALSANVRLYSVKAGRRAQVASFPGRVALGGWHDLRVFYVSDRIVIYFDDLAVMDVHDSDFSGPGKVGLWTKSDSQVELDDLEVGPFFPYWDVKNKAASRKKGARR